MKIHDARLIKLLLIGLDAAERFITLELQKGDGRFDFDADTFYPYVRAHVQQSELCYAGDEEVIELIGVTLARWLDVPIELNGRLTARDVKAVCDACRNLFNGWLATSLKADAPPTDRVADCLDRLRDAKAVVERNIYNAEYRFDDPAMLRDSEKRFLTLARAVLALADRPPRTQPMTDP